MHIEQAFTMIDAAQIDPRPSAKKAVEYFYSSELTGCTDDGQRARFASRALSVVAQAIAQCIESGNYQGITAHLAEFQITLRREMDRQRTSGELRPITPSTEIMRCAATLRGKLYYGPEKQALESLMRNDEQIRSIDWREIKTDRQVITRAILASATRPVTFRNGPEWRSQFVSDADIAEAIERELRDSQPVRGSGPSAWIE